MDDDGMWVIICVGRPRCGSDSGEETICTLHRGDFFIFLYHHVTVGKTPVDSASPDVNIDERMYVLPSWHLEVQHPSNMFWFKQGLCFLPAFLVIWSSGTFVISYIIAIYRRDVDVIFPYIR